MHSHFGEREDWTEEEKEQIIAAREEAKENYHRWDDYNHYPYSRSNPEDRKELEKLEANDGFLMSQERMVEAKKQELRVKRYQEKLAREAEKQDTQKQTMKIKQ